MIEINNRNYDIQISLFCATNKTSVDSAKTKNNASYLNPSDITYLEISTTLLSPFFSGYFDYNDSDTYSYIRSIVNSPFIYGHLTFALVDPNNQHGKSENDSYVKAETFDERIVITGIDSIPCDGTENKSNFRFRFSSIDSLNFEATLPSYSTMDKGDAGEKLETILTTLFSKAGLGGRFDFSKNVPSINMPFMTTCNASLSDALVYIYRAAFDSNILTDNPQNAFFKIVYDHIDKKYKIWRHDSIGENIFNDTPSPDKNTFAYINEKRVVNCDMTKGDGTSNIGSGASTIEMKFSGNVFEVLRMFSDRKYYGYEYIDNDFDGKTGNVEKFWLNNIHSNYKSDKFSVKTSLYEKAQLDKSLKFNIAHSRYRENAGMCDMYNELIFGGSYMHVVASGVIGRKAGDIVLLNVTDGALSPYNKLRGDYFITSHKNIYIKNDDAHGSNATFRSEMECYTPYTQTETNSETSNFVWK